MSGQLSKISRDQLDTQAYDSCVARASRERIYAYSWYLDALADDWYVLVLDDYVAVMPVPYRKKWGFSYAYQPLLVQQLGVFSDRVIEERPFYELLRKNHLHADYTFGSREQIAGSEPKPNIVLDLDVDLEGLSTRFNSNRRRDLKKATEAKLVSRLYHTEEEINAQLDRCHGDVLNELPQQLKQLLKANKPESSLALITVERNGVMIHSVIHAQSLDRIYYLYPITTDPIARSCGAATFAIADLMGAYYRSHQVFDFEGSSISGVRQFYEGFGGRLEPYYHLHYSCIPFIK